MTQVSLKARLVSATMIVACFVSVAYGVSAIDDITLNTSAKDVQDKTYPESKSRQISYHVELQYPHTAISGSGFEQLERRGWLKCSGYIGTWDSYVDISKGAGREQTVFQYLSYWRKGNTLLMIVMRYYAGVNADHSRLKVPDNSDQHVIVTEDRNPDMAKWLKITCGNP